MLNLIKRSKVKLKLALILALYLVLATAYSVVVPIGRGADEWAHYWYAQFIAGHGRLPASLAEREAAGYKSDWPPLYHLFAAGSTFWIDTEGPPTFKYRPGNTCACAAGASIRRQLVPASGPEAILHTEDELFPWQQEILIWHLGRFLSITFSLSTLMVTYFIAVEVFSSSKITGSKLQITSNKRRFTIYDLPFAHPQFLAILSVSVLAFTPRFLFTSMLFNYDSLTLFLSSLFLWLVIRVAEGHYLRWGFLGLGALAGLALITKYLTALLPFVIVVLVLVVAQRQSMSTGRSERLLFFRYLGQGLLAFLLIAGWWFAYLLVNFNEIDTYGPVLGSLAPLLRGDASDRTVEEMFAWLSGGQASPPAYIEKQRYPAWQIMAELPTTFWGNAIARPYPLNWFVGLMSLVALAAMVGLVIGWRKRILPRFITILLILYCLLPLPFMVIRLFGARDALEAVQGRHILFLAGPAVAVLLVWGLRVVVSEVMGGRISRLTYCVLPVVYHALLGLLLVAALSQLIFMQQTYAPLLPVKTTPYTMARTVVLPQPISLEGKANLIDVKMSNNGQALQVDLIWQIGDSPLPEDYQIELALVDEAGEIRSGWRAYQTQARYPTRAWESGDVVRDEGWLPLVGLPAGDYQIKMQVLGRTEPVVNWLLLTPYALRQSVEETERQWVLWCKGEVIDHPPLFNERETVQITFSPGQTSTDLRLIGPDGMAREPIAIGSTWANFIINPDWPAGEYCLAGVNESAPLLRVVGSRRNFQLPAVAQPLDVDFEEQIKLLGYDLPSRRVQPGEGVPLTLYWQGLQWLDEDFVIFNRLLDNQQVAWGGYDRLPREDYSTLLWAPGEIVTDGFAVPVAADAPDGVYTLSVGWYRTVNGQAESLAILNPETGEPTGETAVTIGPIKVGGPLPGVTVKEVSPQTEVNVVLGEQIELLGFDYDQTSLSVDLTFYWQALTRPDRDYTVFVHVRNATGEVVAQKDGPPAGGVYPTGLWDQGEIIKDQVSVPMEQLEPGRYEVVLGMYDLVTGQRLAVKESSEGSILLQSFEVGE
ncbi:MAG: glycosyltransferase family 39 protein [Anaerolineae bacterium]|nr:glycosyltransferase family 39 protein [Anaerolineae bacterium]